MMQEESKAVKLFFFTPKFRKSEKVQFQKQLKGTCTTFSSTISNICQKSRDTFVKHISKLSNWELMIESGEEYLKNFYGFVFDPNVKPNINVETNEDGEVTQKGVEVGSNLPVSKLRHCVKYQWKTSLCKDKQSEFQDSFYEASCVLYDIMVAHMLVIEGDLEISSRTKNCFQRMLKVWGITEFLQNCFFVDPFNEKAEVPFDMQKNSLSALRLMSIAHVQELAILFAIDKENKQELVAKLSKAASSAFLEAYKKVEVNLKSEWTCKELTCFGDYLYLKHKIYEVYAFVYNAIHQNKLEENGKAIKLIQKAKFMLGGIRSDLKKFKLNYWRKQTKYNAQKHVDYIVGTVERWESNFTKENDLVYHQNIPDDVPELVGSIKIGKPNKYILPEASSFWKEYESFVVVDEVRSGPALDESKKDDKIDSEEGKEGGVYQRSEEGDASCSIL